MFDKSNIIYFNIFIEVIVAFFIYNSIGKFIMFEKKFSMKMSFSAIYYKSSIQAIHLVIYYKLHSIIYLFFKITQ